MHGRDKASGCGGSAPQPRDRAENCYVVEQLPLKEVQPLQSEKSRRGVYVGTDLGVRSAA